MNFQNQIDDLRSENSRLRQMSSNTSNSIRTRFQDLNVTDEIMLFSDSSSESDVDEIDNLTFGKFEDFLARIHEADLTSSDRLGLIDDSSDEEVENLTFGSHSAFLARIKKLS